MNRLFSLSLAFALLLPAQQQPNPTVRFRTNFGDIDVQLFRQNAPATVDNFLKYMESGRYDNTIFHRSVAGFIIQGGGWVFRDNSINRITADPPVRNEFQLSNTRGTIAMAKLDGDPNSATSEWFFNLADNSANLNNQNGGFTAFGRITNDAGLRVMDTIAALRTFPALSFDTLPLTGYTSGPIAESNLIIVRSMSILPSAPSIGSAGALSAGAFGGFPSAAPGSFIEIFGSNLAGTTRTWATADFANNDAPTSLDDVRVTIGGVPAFISYISPGQINAQVPANVLTDRSLAVVVTYQGQPSTAAPLLIRASSAGILAPPQFRVNNRQYVAALRADGSFVTNGSIPGIPAAPARPGETLLFYGNGFGRTTPDANAHSGRIATGPANLATPVRFTLGEGPAARDCTVLYAGLAPGFVGLYQFNVTLPSDLPRGVDLPLTITLGTAPLNQNLFLPIAP